MRVLRSIFERNALCFGRGNINDDMFVSVNRSDPQSRRGEDHDPEYEEEEEEILGSDDDEQEDPKDYTKGEYNFPMLYLGILIFQTLS